MVSRSLKPELLAVAGSLTGLLLVARVRSRHRTKIASLADGPRCRVVVVGAGFGGLNVALRLAGNPAIDLTVIDVQNHHVFQPLLYQVATASLAPDDIASPIRSILPAVPHVRVIMAEVSGIDTWSQQVICSGRQIPYDELVVATGSRSSYFGHEDWAQAAPGLKSLDDALALRSRILSAFERADATSDPTARAFLLTFVLIGAGPTGVEMAGSVAELCRETLRSDPELRRTRPRILLVEAGNQVLASFTPDLSDSAVRALSELGVEVRTGTRVTAIEDGAVHLGKETIKAATIIWTAGTTATPVAAWLGVEPGHGGRVAVEPGLQVAGHDRIRVIGDAALARDRHGQPLPALAPVAKQQGHYVAKAILRRLRGRHPLTAFRYRDYGTMATIGRGKAVAELGAVHLTGVPAWVLWAAAHIFFLIGFRSRFVVTAQWALAFATNARPGRLILEGTARREGDAGKGTASQPG